MGLTVGWGRKMVKTDLWPTWRWLMEKIQQWSRKRPIFGLRKSSDLEDFLSIDIDCGAHNILNLDSSNSAWSVLQYLHCSVSVPDSYRVAQDDTYNSESNEIGTKGNGGLERPAQSNYVAELLSQKILGLESGVKDTKMMLQSVLSKQDKIGKEIQLLKKMVSSITKESREVKVQSGDHIA